MDNKLIKGNGLQKAANILRGFVNKEEILEKAKYFKREGTPGNYKYYYTEEEYKKSKGRGKQEKPNEIKVGEHTWKLVPGNEKDMAHFEGSNGSKYWIKSGESKEDFVKRVESSIKDDYKHLNKEKGGSSSNFTVGDTVKISAGIQSDPAGMKGQIVKVTKIDGDILHVKNSEGKTGMYMDNTVEQAALKEISEKREGKKESSNFDQKKFNDAISKRDTNALISEANKMSDEQLEKTFEHHYQMASLQQPGHTHIVNVLGKIRDARKEKRFNDAIDRRDASAVKREAEKMSDEQLDRRIEHHYQMASHQQPGHIKVLDILSEVRDSRKR